MIHKHLFKLAFATLLCVSTHAWSVPVAFYDFEGNINDVSGNGNHGTSSTAGFGAGFEGQGLDIDPGEVAVVPTILRPGFAPRVTIGTWVDVDAVGTRGTILSTDTGGFDRGLNIDSRGNGTNSYTAFTGSGQVLPGPPASPGDGFVFMAATFDQVNGQVTLNVDGNVSTRAATQGDAQNFMRIGLHAFAGEPLDGQVDNVFVYNSVLTNDEIEAIRTGGKAVALQSGVGAGELIQVDLQVDGNGPFTAGPVTNPGIGNGDVWNGINIPSFSSANPIANPAVNPSFSNLLDSQGNATGISLNLEGSISGFNNGAAVNNPVNDDYIFWGISGTSDTLGWSIDGLVAGGEYELALYGGSGNGRQFNMLVDTNGDGNLGDEVAKFVNVGLGQGAFFASVFADSNGRISGLGDSPGEANWGGFQLRVLSTPVPEPTTALLLATGAMGLVRRRRRNA